MRRRTIALFSLVVVGISGCGTKDDSPLPTWPSYPVCFVEMGRGSSAEDEELTKNFRPIVAREVLLIPHYWAYSWKTGEYERIVAHPFLYKPKTPLVIPSYRPGYKLGGVVVLAPGYFGIGILRQFYAVEKVDGKDCQLQRIMKARDSKETERILRDFRYLLSQKEVTLGGTRNPLRLGDGKEEEHVYALTTTCITPGYDYVDGCERYVYFSVWPCEKGTKLSVDLTGREVKLVTEFFEKTLKQLSGKAEVDPKAEREGVRRGDGPERGKS